MVLNFVLPTIMVIEGTMIAVQGYAFSYNINHFYARIDEIYLGTSFAYFLINIIWILHFRREKQQYNIWSRLARGIQGFLMIAIGSLMIQSAKIIEVSNNCASFEIIYTEECQRYESKLIAGILALIVSIFYLLPPVKPVVIPSPHVEVITNYANNNSFNYKDHHREKFKNMFLIDAPSSHQSSGNFKFPIEPYNSSSKGLEILNPSGLQKYETQQQQQQQQQHYTPRGSIISIDGTHMIPRAHHKHCPRVHFNPHAKSVSEL